MMLRVVSLMMLVIITSSASAVVIEVKEMVRVQGSGIRLGDVVNIFDVEPQLKRELEEVWVGSAPLPGRKRILDRENLKLYLSHNGYNTKDFEFTGAESTEVLTLYQNLSAAELVEAAKTHLLKVLKQGDEKFKYKLDVLSTVDEISIPDGEVRYEVPPIEVKEGKKLISIPVKVFVDGRECETVRVRFKIRKYAEVIVAKDKFKRYHPLREEDLAVELREITNARQPFFTKSSVVGKRTTTIINPGRIIEGYMIEEPPLIERGQSIIIKKILGAMSVTALGCAKESGCLGDRIKVQNVDSKKVVEGVVRSSNLVVIE